MIHVAFTPSATGTIMELLRTLGRDERAVMLDEDFAVGPFDDRAAALSDIYWEELDPRGDADREKRWAEVIAAPEVTVWRGDGARDAANVLELITRRAGPIYIGELRERSDAIITNGGLQAVRPLDDLARARDRASWAALRAENADLRVLQDGRLRSEPIEYFDERLLAAVPMEWGIFHVVARHAPVHSERLAMSRMLTLIDDGRVELEELEEPTPVYRLRVRRSRRGPVCGDGEKS